MVNALLASVAIVSALPMPGEDEARRFDEAFERGEALYGKGDYGAAIAMFREADRLKVTPEVAFDLARSFEKLGDAAFATLYDRLYLARSPEASDASEVLQRVNRTLAKEEEDGLSFVEIFAPGASSLRIASNHFPAPPAALFLPPGDYVVEGVFHGAKKSLRLQVTMGRVTSAWFEPVRPPMVKANDEAPAAAVEVKKPATGGASGLRVASYVALGVAAAALTAGIVTGALASGDATRSRDLALTVREAREAAAGANSKATAANILFVVGGVSGAAGGGLFVFSMPEPGVKKEEP